MIELLNTDNIQYMKTCPDNFFDLAIVDPQTGQNEGKKHASRSLTVRQKNGNNLSMDKRAYKVSEWDKAPPPHKNIGISFSEFLNFR